MPDRRTLIRIGKWKAYGRIERRLSKNRDKKVASTSRMAFESISQDCSIEGSIEAIKHLRDGIRDLGIPMASAILTMYDPLNFGVIDTRAWSALFDKKTSQITSYRQWGRYLREIRRLAKLHPMKCREIDASLWFVGSLNARSRRLENT
nr:hypothetical protein [Candidatus Njordarchaeota archaeon]